MAQLQLRRILDVIVGARLHELAQARKAIGGEGMAAREGVLVGVGDVLLLGEALERLQHAAARLLGRGEKLDARLVGGQFLVAPLGQQASA